MSMYRLIFVVLAFLSCAQVLAHEPERYPGRAVALEREAAAYRRCVDSLYDAAEAEACTEWIALAACEMTYRELKSTVSSHIEVSKYAQYRAAALKAFPAYCDPMTWVNLALESLDEDAEFDAVARQSLWQQILERSGSLTPEQRLIVAREWVSSPDVASEWGKKPWASFAITARDDAKGLFPEISADGVKFLSEALAIESSRKSMGVVDDGAKALLLLDAIDKHQYETARELLMSIDVEAIAETYRTAIAEKVAPFAQAILGRIRLADGVCYREFELGTSKDKAQEKDKIDKQIEGRLQMLALAQGDSRIGVLRYEAKERFKRCDFDPVFRRFIDIWNVNSKDARVINFGDELVEYVEEVGDVQVILRALDVFQLQLQGSARRAFVDRYGARYAKRIGILAQSAFDIQSIANRDSKNSNQWAKIYIETLLKALKDSYEIAPDKSKPELALMTGRLYILLGNREVARQYLSTIIDSPMRKMATSRVVVEAYRIMYRTLQDDKKHAEAEALRSRFVGVIDDI